MFDSVGEGFDESFLLAIRAQTDGESTVADRQRSGGALAFVDFDEGSRGFARHLQVVDEQRAAAELDRVPRQSYEPLYVILAVRGVAEHHHIAAFGFAEKPTPLDERANRERTRVFRIAVGHLVHEYEVADQQRVLHGTRRNPEGLEKEGAEHAGDQERPKDGFYGFDEWVPVLLLRHLMSPTMGSGLNEGSWMRCQPGPDVGRRSVGDRPETARRAPGDGRNGPGRVRPASLGAASITTNACAHG